MITPGGGRMQSGIPRGGSPGHKISYLVRGVVIATYVSDDTNNPYGAQGCTDVYCDVLVYTNMPGGRFYTLPLVLVTPDVAGLQSGRIYRPRAAKSYLTGESLVASDEVNPAQLDGDHVLVGFIDGDRHQAAIVRFLPHPSKDSGNSGLLAIGQRQGLRLADGDPSLFKHHGSFYGISDGGDFLVDTSTANNGTLLANGAEPTPGSTGSGNIVERVGANAQLQRSAVNAATPGSPVELLHEALSASGYSLDLKAIDALWQLFNATGNVLKLQHSGSATRATIGDGEKSVAIAEQIQAWWNNTVVPYIQTQMIFDTQLGPTQPGCIVAPPNFDASIISGKVKIPAN